MTSYCHAKVVGMVLQKLMHGYCLK